MPSYLYKRDPEGKEKFLQYTVPDEITFVTTRFDHNMAEKIILAYCAKHDRYTDVFECPAPHPLTPASEINWQDQLTADNYLDQIGTGDEMTITIRRVGELPTQYVLEHFAAVDHN